MSRIGKKPVVVSDKVKVNLSKNNHLKVEGPLGKVELALHRDMLIDYDTAKNVITVKPPSQSKFHRSLHGLVRTLVDNAVIGVTKGFEKRLQIVGVGFNAKVEGNKLTLQIGFSHPVKVTIPKGITIETPKPQDIIIKGADKQLVGEIAAEIRRIRPPEPYKGKGIRYVDEHVRRKAGKALAAAK